ncbi:MAG: phosphoglycolate phosphatase [Actinomycetota bacterium]|jgi:phosphoglycolate phosphatase|nr:phosphoglycolate phosphatase [Actinomycetota bacterium]
MAELKTLLFDLDGTLVRTREASWELFRKTNEKFGLGVDTPSAFFRLFNQNFYAALDEKSGRLSGTGSAGAESAAVKRHFQELLRQDYHPDLVPGMANVVHALAGHYTLIVLSSNTMEAVRRILLACDVAHCFAHVFSGDVTPSKVDAIQRFLADPSYSCGRRCSPHYEESTPQRLHDPQEAMLITDTVGDIEEALSAGIRVGAVSWGMHRAEDLEAAGAEFVCIWPEEIVAYLKPGEICSLGVCTLPSAVAGPPPVVARVPAEPGAVRRRRRQQSAADLAASVGAHSGGCDCAESCCTGSATGADPLLRQVLTVIGSQVSGERLSTRTEESVPYVRQQLAPMAAPNGGRVPPQ